MILQGRARHPVREAVLHCAAIKTGQFKNWSGFQTFSEINEWHRKRGFNHGFGYHGLFLPNGSYYPGRPWSMIGAHVQGHNNGTLGFLLIESREITRMGEFDDWFTTDQRLAVQTQLREIDGLWKVSGHNDYAPKLCPGFRVHTKDWL